MRYNPNKIMATLHTYTSPAGLKFPVLLLEDARQNAKNKAVCLPIGHMPMEISPERLTLGVML